MPQGKPASAPAGFVPDGFVPDAPSPPAAAAPAAPDRAGYYRGVVDMLPSASTVANALPAIGGMVGGAMGGIPGAAIGGAVGQGYRQLAKHATELPGAVRDVARNLMEHPTATAEGASRGMDRGAIDTGVQAVSQAALQKAGDLVGTAARKSGTYLMDRALNLTDRLSREFPNLSETIIKHSLTVTKGGLNEARTMLRAAKDEANAALQTAHASGQTVPITAATNGLTDTLAKVMESGDLEGGLRTIAAVERKMIGGRGATLNPMEADALKRSLQTQSKALYLAGKMGNGRPNATIQAEAIKDMARTLNEGIASVAGPAYKAANADAAEMIGAVRGITKGTRSGSNLYQAMVRPGVGAIAGGVLGAQHSGAAGAIPGAVVGAALTSPAGMSKLAVTLAKPSVQAMLKQSPRLAAALAQLMSSSQEPE